MRQWSMTLWLVRRGRPKNSTTTMKLRGNVLIVNTNKSSQTIAFFSVSFPIIISKVVALFSPSKTVFLKDTFPITTKLSVDKFFLKVTYI